MFFVLVDEQARGLDVRPVDQAHVVVGRLPRCDIVIRSGRIFTEHLLITFQEEGQVTLTHKASWGGNVVNGQRLSTSMTCALEQDVRIRMWEHVLFITRDPRGCAPKCRPGGGRKAQDKDHRWSVW